MTREEYITLLQASTLFKSMPQEQQNKALEADISEQDEYVQIFKEADSILMEVQTQFMEKNAEIVKNFVQKVKQIKKQKLIIDENQSALKDRNDEELLLKQLAEI